MDLIEGRKSNTGIRHIFIDEAQDYSPFQFAYLQKLYPYSKMTLLGDFNQAIFSGATGLENVLSDFLHVGEDVERMVYNINEETNVFRVETCDDFETGTNTVFVNFDETRNGILITRKNYEDSNVLMCDLPFNG